MDLCFVLFICKWNSSSIVLFGSVRCVECKNHCSTRKITTTEQTNKQAKEREREGQKQTKCVHCTRTAYEAHKIRKKQHAQQVSHFQCLKRYFRHQIYKVYS